MIAVRVSSDRNHRGRLGPHATWTPARHLYRLTGDGARFAEALRTAAAPELPRASQSGGVIRPALGEAL